MQKITPINPEGKETGVSSNSFVELFINDSIKKETLSVKINDEYAYVNENFSERFSGDFSLYDIQDSGVSIIFDPTFEFLKNKIITVYVYFENESGEKISENYWFRTEESGPFISNTNINDGDVIRDNQIIYIEVSDYNYDIFLDSLSLVLNGSKIIDRGIKSAEYSGGDVSIVYNTNYLTIRVTPNEFFRNGPYNLELNVSNINSEKLRYNIKYNINLNKFIHPPIFPPSGVDGFRIVEAAPVGDGGSINVKWKDFTKRTIKSESMVLTYISSKRLNITDSNPYCITIDNSVSKITLPGFKVGMQIYVLNRLLESYPDVFDFSNLSQIADGTYKIPDQTTVSEFFGIDDRTLKVESVDGYPKSGLLVLGNSEVVKYSSINYSTKEFIIDEISGRGLNETSSGIFIDGDSVNLFLACQDSNLNIVAVTPIYSEEHSAPERNLIGTAVTNYEDQDSKVTQSYDYCGYHSKMPQNTLNGIDDCGTYLGGEFNGMRGFNIFDRMVAREEILLDQTGEPCILFKRKWSGQTCSCTNNNGRHPRMKTCNACFGTGFIGGFDQFINKKRNDTRLQFSFGETVEDLKLNEKKGYTIQYEPSCWTLPYPTIRDRDVLLRFDYTNDSEYFYEVLDVTREKSIYLHYTRQRIRLKRLEKTDIYQLLTYNKNW